MIVTKVCILVLSACSGAQLINALRAQDKSLRIFSVVCAIWSMTMAAYWVSAL